MKTYPAAYLAQLQQSVNTLAVCWAIVRRDLEVIRGTELDEDIVITTGNYAGTYPARAGITGSDIRSTSDMSVENLEVNGRLSVSVTDTSIDSSSLEILDLNAADIEAGLLDNADVVIFMVDYTDPDAYQDVRRVGWLGNITRVAEGQYSTELRGLTQALSQGIVRTYGVACDAELGDARCKVNLADYTVNSAVDQTDSRRRFKVDGDTGDLASQPATGAGEGKVVGGKITWTSGENTGFSMEVKTYSEGAPETLVNLFWVELFLPMPRDINLGDTFTFTAGCGKSFEDCQFYDNVLNFRGHGLLVPGDTALLQVGKR